MRLAIVIPAYNEEKMIGEVLKSLPKKIKGVGEILTLVIDDGSSDKTCKIAQRNADHVFRHYVNMGVGTATSTGLEAAKRLDADIVVTFDADGQHSPKDIEKLIKPILNDKADVVIGTRMKNTKNMPAIKIVGNWILSIFTYIVLGKWTTDSQSGLKAFSKEALNKINLESVGYEICSEVVGEIKKNNFIMREVTIKTIYSEYSKRKGQNIFNGMNILVKMILLRLKRIE